MKRLIVVISIIFILSYSISWSQKYSVGINIPSLALLNMSFDGGVYFSKKSSITIGLAIRPKIPINDQSIFFNLRGISITPSYHYYFKSAYSNSLFIGPYFKFQKYSTGVYYEGFDDWSGLTINKYSGLKIEGLGLGLLVGYRFYKNNYSFDFFIGPRMSKYLVEVKDYHLPNETYADYTVEFNEAYDLNLSGAGDVHILFTTYYEKRNFPVSIPGVLLGFSFNYFINIKNKQSSKIEYEDFYN